MTTRNLRPFRRPALRRAAVALSALLCVGTALFALPAPASAQSNGAGANGNGANAKANDRGSFVSRLGASLRNNDKQKNAAAQARQAAQERQKAQQAARTGQKGPNGRNGQAGVPTPRPLPSQRLAAQAASKPVQAQRQDCLLRSSHKIGSADVVEISLEASGEVLQTVQDGTEERAPMEVVAGFKYEERFERCSPTGTLRTIREYEQAGMKRKFGSTVARPLLDRSRKFIVSEFDGKKTTIFSPAGPMKNEQYSLLSELPCNTTLLDRLLPNRSVKLGEDWRLPNDVLAALLGVDAIENNTARLTLTSIVDDVAEVDLYLVGDPDAQGNPGPSTLQCASDGATVELDLEGKFQFDLKSERIAWFGLRVDERRSESIAAPGLEWSATLQIKIAPLAEPEKLTDDVVAPLRVEPTPELLSLYYNGQKGFWKFRHSRRWKMIEDGETASALCYVVGGEAIAQCNVLANGKIELDSRPTIDGYKAEIRKGLGSRFGSFVQEAAYDAPNGDAIDYVVVDGRYDETPFRWAYYLITDKDGNQATVMFEIRADMLDQYDDSGVDIVESFRLVPRVDPEAKAAAEAAASAAAKSGKPKIDVPNVPEGAGVDGTTEKAAESDDGSVERAPSPKK